jgi:hypothetical protein
LRKQGAEGDMADTGAPKGAQGSRMRGRDALVRTSGWTPHIAADSPRVTIGSVDALSCRRRWCGSARGLWSDPTLGSFDFGPRSAR